MVGVRIRIRVRVRVMSGMRVRVEHRTKFTPQCRYDEVDAFHSTLEEKAHIF